MSEVEIEIELNGDSFKTHVDDDIYNSNATKAIENLDRAYRDARAWLELRRVPPTTPPKPPIIRRPQ